MYDVAFQNVLPMWDEFSSTIPEPLGSDMDYVRMMFDESSSNICMVDLTGLENNILDMDCGHCILEDFQITEVPELLIENNGARSGNLGKPISDEPSKESCLNSETVISSCVSFQDSGSEAISMFGMPTQHCGGTYLPPCHDEIGAVQEELSTLAEDTLIYGASNFGVDCFLLSNDGPFAYSSTINHERAKDTDRKCMNFESVVSVVEPSVGRIDARRGQESMYTISAPVRGRARSKRSRSIAWSNSCVNWSNFPTNYTVDSAPALSSYTTFCPTPTNSLDSTSDFSSVTTTNVWYPSSELGSWATTKSPTDESCPTSMQSTMPADEFQIAAQEAKSKSSSTHKRKKGEENGQPRRCTHCLSQKTPQWRAGPGGPKTLCNACGVRFKSGRLFPEYRPARSPTFLSDKHSNSHRKVLELRGRWNIPR